MTTELRTALVVDDEEQLLRLLSRVLERAGYAVLTAGSAVEARTLFAERSEEIDLAVLDVIMPGGGAAQLLPKLWDQRPDLHVILTSGDSLPAELETLLATGKGQFLRKPFVPKRLLRLVGGGGDDELAGEDEQALSGSGRSVPGRA